MAVMTRCDFSRSGSLSSSGSAVGMTCHDTPNLSLSQPHGPCSPPSDSLVQHASTSPCPSQSTWNEVASLNVNCGPPFRATNFCPCTSKLTVITVPSGRGPAAPYRVISPSVELGKIDV